MQKHNETLRNYIIFDQIFYESDLKSHVWNYCNICLFSYSALRGKIFRRLLSIFWRRST